MLIQLLLQLNEPEQDVVPQWIAPVMFGIVFICFLVFLIRVVEHWYAWRFDRPLIRNLFVYKRLSPQQELIIDENFPFYKHWKSRKKKILQHRIVSFIESTDFEGRGISISDEMKIIISTYACLLTFGRKYFKYILIDKIIIYPEAFYNGFKNSYHVGEFSPSKRTLALSWADVLAIDPKGKRNLLIHEFMHALQWEAKVTDSFDSDRFRKYYQKMLRLLLKDSVRKNVKKANLRAYAFTNEYEFMSELAEYFYQHPLEFSLRLPEIYHLMRKILNLDFKKLTYTEIQKDMLALPSLSDY